ncbi:energy-coupling factor ABC transporter permease [Enterococcus faecalis]|nr:energy-coupling factor ABC transporter permease [Enterococcus faecalis]NSV46810.1 energy-coupling factor ABC transporter permease [Enterococcus faecalis]HDT8169904.1 energy-coupling factor ABC transporter permease [Enterococcus faecalis]
MKKIGMVGFIALLVSMILPQEAHAMHIMEGFLPIGWSIFWYVVFAPFFVYGLTQMKKIVEEDKQNKVLLALSGALIFVLSALKIPSVTGSTSHPTGVGLGTAIFGPAVISVLGTICLLFQALFLAHGGITTLGANAFSMAVVGPFVGYGVYKLCRKMNLNTSICLFACAFLADISTYLMTSIQLGVVFPDPSTGIMGAIVKFMGVFLLTQVPIGIAEGLLTVVTYNLLSTSMAEQGGILR